MIVWKGESGVKATKKMAIFLVCLLLFLAVPVTAGAEEANLTSEQQILYNQMLKAFIAPDFCGKSLEECPATITVEMRNGILKQVQEGKTKEEIIDYWTGVYGTKILAAPPKSGFFLSAWILPILGILAGVGILGVAVKARMKKEGEQKTKKATKMTDNLEYEAELEEEILRHL